MEVTFNYREGAYCVYMCFYILAFRIYPTVIWAGHWVALAHWPVAVDHVFRHRAVVMAVVAAERTLGAGLALMSLHMSTLEVLEAAGTRNCCKRTANQLLVQLWVQVQVDIQFP